MNRDAKFINFSEEFYWYYFFILDYLYILKLSIEYKRYICKIYRRYYNIIDSVYKKTYTRQLFLQKLKII